MLLAGVTADSWGDRSARFKASAWHCRAACALAPARARAARRGGYDRQRPERQCRVQRALHAPCAWVPTEEHAVVVPTSGVLTAWRLKEFSINDLAGEVFKLVVLRGNKAVAIDPQVLPSKPEFPQNVYEFTTNIPVPQASAWGSRSQGSSPSWPSTPIRPSSRLFGTPPLALNDARPTVAANYKTNTSCCSTPISAPRARRGGGSTPVARPVAAAATGRPKS